LRDYLNIADISYTVMQSSRTAGVGLEDLRGHKFVSLVLASRVQGLCLGLEGPGLGLGLVGPGLGL